MSFAERLRPSMLPSRLARIVYTGHSFGNHPAETFLVSVLTSITQHDAGDLYRVSAHQLHSADVPGTCIYRMPRYHRLGIVDILFAPTGACSLEIVQWSGFLVRYRDTRPL